MTDPIHVSKLVDDAVALNIEIAAKTAKLKIMKDQIRELATVGPEETKLVLRGTAGTAEVVYVSDKAKILKGANPYSLQEALGEMGWNHLFAVEVKPASDFASRLEHLPRALRTRVLDVVSFESQEPRVTLK